MKDCEGKNGAVNYFFKLYNSESQVKRINDIFETYQNCKTGEKVFGAIMSQEVEVKVEKKFASVSFEEIEKWDTLFSLELFLVGRELQYLSGH